MSLSDQENHDQPAKRRKRGNHMKPFALSQQIAMDTSSSNSVKSTKRQSSVPVDAVVAKKARSQTSQFPVYPDDEESSRFERSSAGVVMSVSLINFMCHSNFEIKLNPRINFISGSNGSGKSAIQTALVIGLGGVASKTNRSSRIDGLIKHGCQSGRIIITLSNQGWNAYKPQEYGPSIQIVRNITHSSSNYKVYNHSGRLMASTKKEVENICTRFRIQPNNPVAILNQDMARNFLSSNKAEDKYTLFRKAILLDEAEVVLSQLVEMISDHENQLESKKRAIMQIKDEIDKMSKKMKLVEDLRLSKAKKFELENELAWSKVKHRRDEVKRLTSCRDDQDNIKNKLSAELNKLQAEEEELNNKKKKFENDIAIIQAQYRSKEEERQRLSADHLKIKKLYHDKCMEHEILESSIKSLKKDYADLRTGLDDIQRMDLEQKEKKEDANRQISKLKQELDIDQSKLTVLEGETFRLRKISDGSQEEMSKFKRSIEDMRRHIETCQRQIQSLGNKSDTLSMYEPWMRTLVQKIDDAIKNNKFSKPPLGPLGRYIKVEQEPWIYAIESNLSVNLLSSFLVNNSNDRRVLYSIMDQVIRSGHKPTVHCSRFQEQGRDDQLRNLETSHPKYSNMLRALTVNNVVVTNFLMDYRSIHRILLVENKEDCRHFVYDDRNLPVNCTMILDLEADQYLQGYKVYANYDRNRRARILRKSAADQLRSLHEEIAEKQEQINLANTKFESTRSECAQNKAKMREISRDVENLKKTIIGCKGKLRELRNVIELEVPSLQMKLDEMNEIEKELAQLEEKREVLIRERTEAEEGMTRAKKQMYADNQGDSFSQQTQLNNDKDKVEKQLNALNNRISNLRNNIGEQNKKLSNLEARIAETSDRLSYEENTASQLTDDEPQASRSTSEVQRCLKEVEKFIEEAKKKMGGEENKFQQNYYDKKDSLENQVEYFKKLVGLLKESKDKYSDRKMRIGKIRDTNAIVIMTQFQTVLHSRNYRGNLKFDHQGRKLDILMAPIDGGNTLMNTSSLSGGEKSYSTVAFLLALWSNMELPFYSMDEYDVFMDAINRKTITKLLMNFAKNKENKQFIFLTPLDVSIIQIGDHVQVHKVNKIQS